MKTKFWISTIFAISFTAMFLMCPSNAQAEVEFGTFETVNDFLPSDSLMIMPRHLPFDAYYMVDAVGSYTPQPQDPNNPNGISHYPDTVNPVLYLKVPTVGDWGGAFTQAWLNTTIYKDGVPVLYMSWGGPNGQTEFWLDFGAGGWTSDGNSNLPPPGGWFDVRDTAFHTWSVYTYYQMNEGCDKRAYGDGITTFTTPEPISSSLFLLGMGSLGLKRFRRKKTV